MKPHKVTPPPHAHTRTYTPILPTAETGGQLILTCWDNSKLSLTGHPAFYIVFDDLGKAAYVVKSHTSVRALAFDVAMKAAFSAVQKGSFNLVLTIPAALQDLATMPEKPILEMQQIRLYELHTHTSIPDGYSGSFSIADLA